MDKQHKDNKPLKKEDAFPGYPEYSPKDDIMNQRKEKEVNISEKDTPPTDNVPELNQEKHSTDLSDNRPDVPGEELDDESEKTGDEDEENNYYSLGGDRHEDLEEDNS